MAQAKDASVTGDKMPKEKPLISVILPVYNGEAFIARALRSVIGQTHRPLELMIVNDGSTDGSPGVIQSFIAEQKKNIGEELTIQYLEQQNAGQAVATNRGISESRGEFIALIDADDEWLPEHLAKTVQPMLENPRIGLAYSQATQYREDGRAELLGVRGAASVCSTGLQLPPHICVPASIYRRECFERCGSFDESMPTYNDSDMEIRVSELYEVSEIPEQLVKVYDRATSQSRNYSTELGAKMKFRAVFKALGRAIVERDPEATLAAAYQENGILYHEEFNKKRARRYFMISFVLHPTWRSFTFILKTLLPSFLLRMIRARRNSLGIPPTKD
jgi:glycosyltransferase involved in cell wall biosynthesis